MTGRVFAGRYQVGERIGIGGMAEVYSAQDTTLGRLVAVKVMLPQYAQDEEFARRFRQEAAAAANLQSPYIVNVYDWGHDDDTYFIVMEYVRGSDLKTAIQQRGAIKQRKVAEIGAQVCQALSVAHQQDIIHRDIKPQNIMVQPDGNVKVMDFGIARAKNSTAQKTETVLGTAHYTSPEQAQGKELTAASDIYSLGIVLYEAVTGTLPFDGPDAVSVALMQVQNFPAPPHEFNPDIDPDLEAIIMTALEKDPGKRFATANDMRLALNDYLTGRPIMGAPGLERDGFTSAQTAVIAPIGAIAGGGADVTQVMPVTPGTAGGAHAQNTPRSYRSGNDSSSTSSNKKKIGIIVGVIAVIALLGVLVFNLLGNAGEKIDVPDVVGETSEVAQKTIEDAGFKVQINNVYDDSKEPGTVVDQNPKGGSKAAKGSKVTLDVSQGTEEVDVPDLKNMTLEEARRAIAQADLVSGETTKEYSEDVEEGKVIRQDPPARSRAPKGSKVNLVISQGTNTATVPSIEGLSLEAARAKVEKEGLVLSQSGTENSSTVSANCIISQSPASGTKVEKGSTVSVVVSLGKKDSTTTVPSVVGSSQAYAENAIRGAGLNVNVVSNYSSNVAAGNVIQQSIEGGTKVEQGTTVTIEVSKGPAPSSSSSSTESG